MKLGYACICLGTDHCTQRTCTQKYASEQKLKEIIQHNVTSLKNILEYNVNHQILLYRISSNIIPFGSSPINMLNWRMLFQKEFEEIGRYIKIHSVRVSFHPGQYTILNAINREVVDRAIEDLRYHASILDAMGLDATHKMILHIGGVYGDKNAAMKRFIQVYEILDQAVKKRLVIENDDRYFDIEDVLAISKQLAIPVIFDNLHHAILSPCTSRKETEWIQLAKQTWKEKDGVQKIHYSQQDQQKRIGAHAQRIDIDAFIKFYVSLAREDIDIMLEVKDKNISAVKCNYLLHEQFFDPQEQWQWYRYLFYLHSPALYAQWENRLQEDDHSNVYAFYKRVDGLLEKSASKEHYEALFRYLLEFIKDKITVNNHRILLRQIDGFQHQRKTAQSCLMSFLRVAEREEIKELKLGLFLFV